MEKCTKTKNHAISTWLTASTPLSGLQCVIFILVSGHTGVKDNERADGLASVTTAMDPADILNAIRDSGQMSLTQVLELGVI